MKSNILLLILFISTSIFAQSTAPQLDKIKQQDLKDDLYELGDAFQGRGGELGEMSFCLGGSKAREAGLKPAGEDGTYFQFFNLKRSRVANSSTVSVNGKALDLWKRFGQLIWWTLEGSVVWLDKMPDNVDLKAKL
jgi:hypothetical protein